MNEKVLVAVEVQHADYTLQAKIRLVATPMGLTLAADSPQAGLAERIGLPWSIGWSELRTVETEVAKTR